MQEATYNEKFMEYLVTKEGVLLVGINWKHKPCKKQPIEKFMEYLVTKEGVLLVHNWNHM